MEEQDKCILCGKTAYTENMLCFMCDGRCTAEPVFELSKLRYKPVVTRAGGHFIEIAWEFKNGERGSCIRRLLPGPFTAP